MSIVLNFKLLDTSKLILITDVLNKNFSVSLFEINDKRICKAVILTNKSYLEIKDLFTKSLSISDDKIPIEFITVRNYFD
jgi:hypothetical protein